MDVLAASSGARGRKGSQVTVLAKRLRVRMRDALGSARRTGGEEAARLTQGLPAFSCAS